MIATGGLLRINARRQDSLRSKPHKPHTHKRKSKKKRRSEVVVVKGKLKLVSVSGLVAAVGILVLMVGMVMAALGYWPRDGLFFSTRPQEGATMASVSSSSSTPADAQGGDEQEEPVGDERENRGVGEGGVGGVDGQRGSHDGFNRSETVNGTTRQLQRGFLEDFLDRYLYSDRLKVFGPLIMGIGIFLFICANAVLHENRDKKTKIINLRDIYSTVIDLHSLRKPNASSARRSSANGLINYIQSKSLETKPKAYPASLMNKRPGGGAGGGGEGGDEPLSRQPSSRGGGGGGGSSDGEGDTVFSIYQEQSLTPPSPSSISPHLPTCWTSLQKEALSSFTLPLRRPRSAAPRRRHSARAGMSWSTKGEEEQRREGGGHGQGKEVEEGVYACPPPPLSSSTPPPLRPFQGSCSSPGLHQEAAGGSQALLLLSSSSLTPSHLSLSSLSHLLSSSSSTPPHPCRRRSLPSASSVTGYSKLMHREEESFESTEMTSSHPVTSYRKYSNREKLRMISQVNSGQSQEEAGRGDGMANQELT